MSRAEWKKGFKGPNVRHVVKILVSLVSLCWALQAWAEPRIALVIGNSAYGSVSALDNPVNDAALIAEKLTDLGFEVRHLSDSHQVDMKRAIAQFGRDLRNGGEDAVGLFYYAGHGVQSFGSNYLLPIDVSLNDPADLDLMAVEARSVLHQMASAKNKTNIVILDACRNNPFEDLVDMDDNGLAEMKAPTGTFLAYATDPGGVALDGETGNSPFTLSLAKHIDTPGMAIEQLFKKVRVDVLEETRGLQTPWDTSSLTLDFTFSTETQTQITQHESEEDLWQAANSSRDPVQIMLFMRAYPNSVHSTEAADLLQSVMAESFGTPIRPAATDSEPEQLKAEATETDRLMYELALTDDTIHSYEVYLHSFPDGVFADDAVERMAALRLGEETVTRKAEPNVEAPDAENKGAISADIVLTLDSPLTFGNSYVLGQSINQLVAGSPQFPPIDGLPEELWKDQSCSNCHQWTAEALCDQAQTYVERPAAGNVAKQHPYGGGLKVNLRRWALDGCQG
ncbi:caspase domain-containing protein [Ruegeria sp. HKCCD7255]|uniref:caspase family protein n=1 Tax=Ruegeria sp. HKCCD7255 TaxID=2683004 RepID=UPI001488A480|nr:caspase domain-containing protein [Ruegeria sp. HKCCD7255]